METLDSGGDATEKAASGFEVAAVSDGTGADDVADTPSNQSDGLLSSKQQPCTLSSSPRDTAAAQPSPEPSPSPSRRRDDTNKAAVGFEVAAVGGRTGAEDAADPPGDGDIGPKDTNTPSPQFPIAVDNLASSTSPPFAAMDVGSFVVLSPPKPDDFERSSSSSPVREQPPPVTFHDLQRSMTEFQKSKATEQEFIQKERDALIRLGHNLKHQQESLKKVTEDMENMIQLQSDKLREKEKHLHEMIDELTKNHKDNLERMRLLSSKMENRSLEIKKLELSLSGQEELINHQYAQLVQMAVDGQKVYDDSAKHLENLKKQLSRLEEEASLRYKVENIEISQHNAQLQYNRLVESLIHKFKQLATTKDDDIWNRRQIILLFALLCGFNLLLSTYTKLRAQYVDVTVALFALVWCVGFAALPFGLFGTMKLERNINRHATFVVYMFLSVYAAFTLFIITIPRANNGEALVPISLNWIGFWLCAVAVFTVVTIIFSWCRGFLTGGDQDVCDRR